MPLHWDAFDAFPLLRWDGPEGIVAAFSGRRGGVSEGPFSSLNLGFLTDDAPEAVRENRRRLCAAVGADPARTVLNHQVHGAAVREAVPLDDGFLAPAELPQADALVTREEDLALVALSADCVPIVIAALDGSALAVVHAGWRGLVAGAIEAAVAALGSGPCAAAVGPCAGPLAYEVGPDVAEPLVARFGEPAVHDGRADLAACAGIALIDSGLSPDAVEIAGLCTITDADAFFSHRRDGGITGRQGVIAYRLGEDA